MIRRTNWQRHLMSDRSSSAHNTGQSVGPAFAVSEWIGEGVKSAERNAALRSADCPVIPHILRDFGDECDAQQ